MPVVGAAALQLFWLFVGFPEASLVLPCQLCGFIINAVFLLFVPTWNSQFLESDRPYWFWMGLVSLVFTLPLFSFAKMVRSHNFKKTMYVGHVMCV